MTVSDRTKRHTELVRNRARNNWDMIFRRLAPQLNEAMAKEGRHVDCPFHGGKDDFRLPTPSTNYPEPWQQDGRALCTCKKWGDGFSVVMDANNWDFPTAVKEIEAVLGGVSDFTPTYVPPAPRHVDYEAQREQDDRIKSMLRRWWKETVPLNHASTLPARQYLRNRKLGQVLMPLEDIGFHPSMPYYDSDRKLVGVFPTLVSIVRSRDGSVSTVHRTFLDQAGNKAPVEKNRKLYSSPSTNPLMGGAIRLDKHDSPVLHVGEGLESALAVRAIMGGADATWSSVNAEMMRALHIPEHVKIVCIWADRDASYGGQLAAFDLMDRVRQMGKTAVTLLPPFSIPEGKKSIDWNDVVANLGLEATRNHFFIVKFLRSLQASRTEWNIATPSASKAVVG